MNRRKFLKFLGRATVASGVVVVSGLPREIWSNSQLSKKLIPNDYHRFYLSENNILPFKSISFTVSGKSELVFRKGMNVINVDEYVLVYRRNIWLEGFAIEVIGDVVILYNPLKGLLNIGGKTNLASPLKV